VWMFPISAAVTIFLLLLYALIAIAIGALSGKLSSVLLGVPTFGLLNDGGLGLLGFLLFGLALTLVPQMSECLKHGSDNPSNVALIAAPVLPFFRELSRLVRYRITSADLNRRLRQLCNQCIMKERPASEGRRRW
jgi:hypothetical protein